MARHTSSTRCARPSGGAAAGSRTVHPADLGAHSINALVERTGIDPGAVDDVIFGNVDSIGPQAGDIARTCWLVAGLPEHVPGTTVDRQCGSAQQAIHFAAQGVMSGTADLIVAGGVQNMSQIPIMSAMLAGQPYGHETPFSESPGWKARYGNEEVSQFRAAELIAEKWNISREDMEAFAVESHERAIRARAEGRFENEIVPLGDVTFDEGPREPNLEKIRSLPPLTEGGRITAAVSSQISDASAALLIASEQAVKDHGLKPRARIHHLSVRADDPIFMLTAPIAATEYALRKAGHDQGRHRPRRDQRGVRVGGARVAAGERLRSRQGERERRRDRARPPARRHRRPAHDHAAERARAHRRALRPADDVRGRRPGQRHHHRAPVTAPMIEIPEGTRVYGMQLPIQAQSLMIAADWERDAGVDELARVIRHADEHGFHYVGVCDHIALTEDYASRMSTFWQDCIGTLSWVAAHHHDAPTCCRTRTCSPTVTRSSPPSSSRPSTTCRAVAPSCGIGAGHVQPEFERLGVDFNRRGKLVDEKLPVLIDALEHEWVDGYGASPRPVQQPRPPVWVAGSSPAAIRRAARLADGWLPQGPSDASMVAMLQDGTRASTDAPIEPMMIGHITPWLYVGKPDWDVPDDSLTGEPQELAEQILAGTADGVNQIQVRFRARSCDELCDQMAAFATDVAPLLTKV